MAADFELLQRIASGDRGAMKMLFERYQTPLFAFLRARGADVEMADDAVQDAMMDVWRSAGRFSGQASVKTWIFTIGRNKLVDRLRKASRYTLVDEVPDQPDDSPDAETILTSAANGRRVRGCLAKLKPAHLTAIRLAFYEDLTYAQIGVIEEVPEGTVKTRVHYAKRLLLKCLGVRGS